MSGPWGDWDNGLTVLWIDAVEFPRMRDATEEARSFMGEVVCEPGGCRPGRPRLVTARLCGAEGPDDDCGYGEDHEPDAPCLREYRVWRYEPKHRCGT